MNPRSLVTQCASFIVMIAAAGCGGGGSGSTPTAYTLGGTVSGLNSGVRLTLQDKSGANLEVASNGAFTFPNKFATGGSYEVSISSQPAGQRCQVSQGSGSMPGADVTNIAVACQTGYAYVLSYLLMPDFTDQYIVTQYTFGANGQMRPVGGADTVIDANRVRMTVDAKGENAYFVVSNKNTLVAYSIGAKGGLSSQPTAIVPTGKFPLGTTLSPNGKFLYSYNNADDSIYRHSLGAGGRLDSLTKGTQVALVPTISTLTIDASGKRAYAADSESNRIYQFSIADDGSFTPSSAGSVATDGYPSEILLDAGGKFAYVVNGGGGSIGQYAIGADGALTPLAPAYAPANRGIFLAIAPNGKYAYASGNYVYTNGSGNMTIAQFSIGANGQLTSLAGASVRGAEFSTIAIDASGNNVYTTELLEKTVTQYTAGANGQLTETGHIATRGEPHKMIVFYR